MTEFSLLKKAIDYSRDGVLIFNSESVLVYANHSFLNFSRYEITDLRGLSIGQFAAKLLLNQPFCLPLETYVAGVEAPFANYRYRLKTKTGEEVPVHLSVFRHEYIEGEGSAGCIMLVHEIKTLLDSQKWQVKTNFLLKEVSVGVLAVNKERVITIFNEKAEEIIGLKKEEVLGRQHDEVFGYVEPRDRLLTNALLYGIELHGQEIKNFPYVKREGVFVVSAAQLKDQHDQVIGAMLIFQDQTEQRKYEEEIARAERLAVVSEIAAGMAHEVRNSLTTIKGFIQLMAGRLDEHVKEKEYFTLMLEELDRANQIITDFLMLSKPQHSDLVIANVNEIINQITMLVESQAFLQGIQVIKELDGSIPNWPMEANQLKQVFLNLVRNAIQAMANGGKLTLKSCLNKKDNLVTVEVIDTGCGIPPEHLSKLFTPFFSTKETGTGLGLTLSYRFIQNHGGSIEVQSQVDKGTTFTVKLPVGGKP